MAWKRQKESKYRSKKVAVDGIIFDSKKEARRYQHLLKLQEKGEISGLTLQVPFQLLPSQPVIIKGMKVKTERPVKYIADFVYKDAEGNTVVEDTKGVRTVDYIIKRKLLLYIYGIAVSEV